MSGCSFSESRATGAQSMPSKFLSQAADSMRCWPLPNGRRCLLLLAAAVIGCGAARLGSVTGAAPSGVAYVGSPTTGRGSASGIDLYDGGHDSQIVGNHIHHIGNVCTLSTNTNGQVGIFVQVPNVTVEGNLIHDIGRFFPGENGCSYTGFSGYMTLDHGMYLNGGSAGGGGGGGAPHPHQNF